MTDAGAQAPAAPTTRLDPASHAWMTAPETRAVLDALRGEEAAGGAPSVRFVGGCVRDALAGLPVSDVDLATDLEPPEVMRRLEAAGLRAVPTGLDHGTVTAVANHRPFEITTLRRDVETDGRRAVVAYTHDWREDAERRDFTFNALSAEPDGTLHDYFGGLADLAAGRVRFVGDADLRIREDVLRILRFCRFHARFGRGAPEGADFDACIARRDLLPQLSAERVHHEFTKLLAGEAPIATIEAMIARGLLAHWLPEALETVPLARLIRREAGAGRRDWLRRLAVLIQPDAGGLGPGAAKAARTVARRLKLSNQEAKRLEGLADPAYPFAPTVDAAARREALYRLGPDRCWDLALLGAARAEAAGSDAARSEAARSDAAAWEALMAEAQAWEPVELPVSGADALAAGLAPGPAVGAALAVVERWWIEQGFAPDRRACLARLERTIEAGAG